MRVYHLLSAKYALADLMQRRIKVAEFSELNDPFELLSVELVNRAARQRFTAWRRDVLENYGVLCFSRNWKNPVLWSHYADRHRGMCLGFEVPDTPLHSVTYLTNRAPLDDLLQRLTKSSAPPEPLFRAKFEHWRYENEVRRILPLNQALKLGNHYFWPFGADLTLTEVVVGPRCSVSRAHVQRALAYQERGVTLTKARLGFGKFEVVTQQRGL
jgi:hypothetical protein